MTTVEQINTDALMGRLTRNQTHAARALLGLCPWCERPECVGTQRGEHDTLDAMSEVTWWRRSKGIPS